MLSLIEKKGPSSETYGILGRVYKDRWEKAYKLEDDENLSIHYLDLAIEAYLNGFQTDLNDPYPGINAITLMELRNPPDPRRQELIPVVKYSNHLKIAKSKPDYWNYATLLELAILTKDKKKADSVLSNVLSNLSENWKGETTLRNLCILREAREKRNEYLLWTKKIEDRMKKRLNYI